MKKTLRMLTLLFISAAIVFSMSACSKTNEPAEEPEQEMTEEEEYIAKQEAEDAELIDNGVYYDEEAEDAELTFKESEKKDFVGTWTADSGQSVYMYGNVELDIKKDGTWTGNIAGEDLKGTWEMDESSAVLESDLFNASLSYTDKNVLIMQEDREGDGDYINTVLKKK